MNDRFELAINRIRQIKSEEVLPDLVNNILTKEADFLVLAADSYESIAKIGICNLDYETISRMNKALYTFSTEIEFESSDKLSADKEPKEREKITEIIKALSVLDAELKAVIPYVFEQDETEVLIRMELFLEIYSCFLAVAEEQDNNLSEDKMPMLPKADELRSIFYYYSNDYCIEATDKKIASMFDENSYSFNVLMNSDWSDKKSLYYYGEYVTNVEEECLEYINSLSGDELKKMADTFTEGYRIGFEVTNKDLSKKNLVEIRYHLGFEPVVKIAVANFEAMGLKTVIRRSVMSLLGGRGMNRIGFEGAIPDKQYVFDHKEDMALVMDKALNTVRLEALSKAFEKYKLKAAGYAGPAVIEVFGEEPFDYEAKNGVVSYRDEQQKMLTKYSQEAGEIQRKYIIEEERSFTIIAFPTPEIGPDFKEIFDEVVKINTLDYMLYRRVQQTIIDTLDKGDYCIVKGAKGNKTNIKVNLFKLENPDRQTIFENCVADVNIPVGEVFTSPVLEGTEGALNVSKVFLNGLEFKNLMLTFENGMVTNYSCENFENEEENKKLIKDNILFHYDSLPIGEFAIGTNTVAYTMAKKYDVGNKLPILIAEKTGPHFAVGDTCYSHSENVVVYNPDGKEIVAKDNSCSLKREDENAIAYFNCHTDITLPYDELGEISVVTFENEVIPIIENGRFVLEGTQILNEALE